MSQAAGIRDRGLRRLALRTVLGAFPGPTPPDWALSLVADGLAGYTLFGFNVDTPEGLGSLTAALRTARADVLVAIDEEAGDVTRLAHRTGSPYPGNAALGAADDVALTRTIHAAVGAELSAVGVNLNLAPGVDVNTADENPIIGTRSFGADPLLVARHGAAAVAGLQSAGVAACAKHFPGHGATLADSHLELPTVDCTLDVLRRRDLPPFVAAIEAGTKAIMTAHIRVPALTGAQPATLSAAALTGLLRTELGFGGVIVSDALEMRGASAALGIPGAAVAALNAGTDLLCLGAAVDEPLVEAVAAAIVKAIVDGRLALARVTDAAARIDALARWVSTADRAAPVDAAEASLTVARRAITVDGVLPVSAALVVHVASGHSIAEGLVPWGLSPFLDAIGLDGVESHSLDASTVDVDRLLARAGTRTLVLVGRHLHRNPAIRALVEALTAAHPTVIVEMGWPSPWRPAGAVAFVHTYGATRANARAATDLLFRHPVP